MRAATLFSGIGAPECAMPHWEWPWHAEIENFPSAVLAARHPLSVNLGDVNAEDFVERALERGRPDVIVFGSPCQDFSVAGQRVGLDGARGNLALVALGIVRRLRPCWFLFENVPGLFSSYSGSAEAEGKLRDRAERGDGQIGETADAEEDSDFAAFLAAVQQCGYLGCYRTLDAQYAGVPQRRRRIFFVGYLGDWRPAAAVLFEPESLRGDSPPSREARQRVAGTISAGLERCSADEAERDTLIAGDVSPTLRAGGNKTGGDRPPGTDVDTADSLIVTGVSSSGDGYWREGIGALRGREQDSHENLVTGSVSSKWAKGTGGPAGDECYNLVAGTLGARSADHTSGLKSETDFLVAEGFKSTGNNGTYSTGDKIDTLSNSHDPNHNMIVQPVAYSIIPMNSTKDYKARLTDVAQPLMAGGPVGGNQGGDFIVIPILEAGARTGRVGHEGVDGVGIGEPGDPMFTLQSSKQHAVAYGLGSHAGTADGEQTNKSHAQGGPVGSGISEEMSHSVRAGRPPAVAISGLRRGDGGGGDTPTLLDDVSPTVDGQSSQGVITFQTRVGRNGRGVETDVVPTLNGSDAGATSDMRPCVVVPQPVAFDTYNQSVSDVSPALRDPNGTFGDTLPAIFKPSHFTRDKDGAPSDLSPPLSREADKGDQEAVLMQGAAVRRLTPRECERLMGFPDDYTLVQYRGKDAADGNRYKALGNSMVTLELKWILSRIEKYHVEHPQKI